MRAEMSTPMSTFALPGNAGVSPASDAGRRRKDSGEIIRRGAVSTVLSIGQAVEKREPPAKIEDWTGRRREI